MNPFIVESPLSLIMVAALSILFMYQFGPAGRKINLLDRPVGRKQHYDSVPLVGGIAICAAVFLSISLLPFSLAEYRILLFSTGLLLVMGVLDDHRDVSPLFKLSVQSIVAIVLVVFDGTLVPNIGDIFAWDDGNSQGLGWVAFPLSFLAIVGVINAVNMADGHDGVASTMFLISIICILVLAGNVGLWKWHYLLLLFAVSTFVHLLFNLGFVGGKEHKIFLGDAGSMVLGLVLVFALIKLGDGQSPALKPTSAPWILGLPLLDMASVVISRIGGRKSPIRADRQHFHHLLVSVGMSRWRVLGVLALLQLFLCSVGVWGHMADISDWILFWAVFPTLVFFIAVRQVLTSRSTSGSR